jgi:hypothetical protein
MTGWKLSHYQVRSSVHLCHSPLPWHQTSSPRAAEGKELHMFNGARGRLQNFGVDITMNIEISCDVEIRADTMKSWAHVVTVDNKSRFSQDWVVRLHGSGTEPRV